MSDTIKLTGALSPREKGYREGYRKGFEDGIRAVDDEKWIPADKPPRVDEDGYSDFILVFFDNLSLPDIGYYKKDNDGSGSYHSRITDEPYSKKWHFVNGWRPLPKSLRAEVSE